MQEHEIIALIQARDERGAEELLKYYGPLMRYIIYPILSDAQDREECLSETAMRVWDKIELYNPRLGSWNAWLTALTRNTALNLARRNRRHGETEVIPPTLPSSEPTPEEVLLQKERQRMLLDALSALSSKDRALFYRKYYYLQSTAQIASELALTERAVEGRLYRIKKRLQKVLGGGENE